MLIAKSFSKIYDVIYDLNLFLSVIFHLFCSYKYCLWLCIVLFFVLNFYVKNFEILGKTLILYNK